MRLLLINLSMFGAYRRMAVHLPPLGVAYLAAVLRERGHAVQILDLDLPSASLPRRFDDFDLVGLSGDTPRHPQVVDLGRRIRAQGVRVVTGGPHVSFLPEAVLEAGAADYVVRGEGELTLAALVERLAEGGDGGGVPGVSWLCEGVVTNNPDRCEPADLDRLPLPARDLLPLDRYQATLHDLQATTMLSSRGCPFDCAFCVASQLFGRRWRCRDPEAVVEELQEIRRRYGLRAIVFLDDNFTLNPERAIQICELIRRRGIKVRWWCFSRVNTIVERHDMVEAMAAAGAGMVFLGIESAEPQVLREYQKRITPEDSVRAVELLRRHGIDTMGAFILGGVRETRRMAEQTIRFARQLRPAVAQFTLLTPYPGTRLFAEVRDRLLTCDWSRFDCMHATVRADHLRPRELERLLWRAYMSFYFRPSRLLSQPLSLTLNYLRMLR